MEYVGDIGYGKPMNKFCLAALQEIDSDAVKNKESSINFRNISKQFK